MSHHLYICLFRNLSLVGHHQIHIYLHSHLLVQTHYDVRACVFRHNGNNIRHLLGKIWLKRQCHQDTRMLWRQKALQKYMGNMNKEYQTLDQCLQNASVHEGDWRSVKRRHAQLAPLVAIFQEIQEAERAIEELDSMCAGLNKEDEKQLQELAVEEKETIIQKISMLYNELSQNLIPKEKHDKNDVILEVTSGRTTGGDICQQFTREIFNMYQNYSNYKHWKFELVNYAPAEYDVKVDPNDLRVDTFRAKGAGGQHVNTTDSAVRLVHVPTGLVVECQQERSQIKNKEIALRVLQARLYQKIIEKDRCQQQNARRLQVGTRAQSERIRTYNFTQNRVTDHRVGYEVRDIKDFLCGEKCLDQLIQKLLQSADEEAITAFLEENFKSAK
ncbi:peptide chain release factor 1, mitochondrial isoform X4 [Erinaceus europaeus]|uniref:Peptide chain release factor 1, mitochondrial isoform X4 n=1 Tax=Erinaceus europaeus TaxID=9365 RepID=A0ABM3XPE0_ERIEU|nr:peptide chain release factor 1, mitochondrial isoform X4 [Erinaceus europaeus]